MAHVRPVERKSGAAYEVRWREHGKERQRTFTVKREADRFAMKVEGEQAAGASTEPLAGRGKTFEAVLDASLAARSPRLKATTYEGYVLLYKARVVPHFGKQRIAAVTSEHVEKWIAGLIDQGLSTNTVRNHYVAVSKVFRYAVRHRLISHNPCDAVQVPRAGTAEDFAPVFLSAAQVASIAAALDAVAPHGTAVRFAAQTGLRSAEITGLRIRDVNLGAGHVQVRQTLKRLNGVWTVGTPKSARSTRNVPLLSRALVGELRELLVAHPAPGDPNALFFPGNTRSRALDWTQPLDLGRVRQYHLVPAARRLDIAEQMRFHDLRHTYASLMLAAGFKPYEVSRWMGHGSVATTDSIYGHLYQADYNLRIAQFEAFVAAR
ncbi:site-specific integrase [Rathayibacter sp. VKM Ac-2927]|uniref:tyrosine-type recombinase/integrase n=1 Tax=Rathayibacter sp. VKM Ac-2927 TaxID=2929478 RepID=UPI001FB1C16F|nr:site-specific integrase [Rathayibacter sp. VKM Ac-2927]MCJ1686209.1 tyrosine-type recombinase/integrase [Rathayibacter sp. VKM Ac-2927]